MICGFPVWYVIKCEACHFGFSAVVGSLAYWLTSIMLSRTGLRAMVPVRRISLWLLLVALSFAVLAHVLEDRFLNWF